MIFILEDKHKDMLDTYNEISSKLVYNDKYLKTKIKFHKNVIKTSFHDNGNGLS